jgi:hypothetical protein
MALAPTLVCRAAGHFCALLAKTVCACLMPNANWRPVNAAMAVSADAAGFEMTNVDINMQGVSTIVRRRPLRRRHTVHCKQIYTNG